MSIWEKIILLLAALGLLGFVGVVAGFIFFGLVISSLIDDDSRSYSYHISKPLFADDLVVISGYSCGVVALDIHTGAVRWHGPGSTRSGAVSDGTNIYYVSGKEIFCLDKAGTIVWNRKVDVTEKTQSIYLPPIIYGNSLYCAFEDGSVVASRLRDGKQLWQSEPKEWNGYYSFENWKNTLILGFNNMAKERLSKLYAINADTGKLKWTRSNIGSPNTVYKRMCVTYKSYWNFEKPDELHGIDIGSGCDIWTKVMLPTRVQKTQNGTRMREQNRVLNTPDHKLIFVHLNIGSNDQVDLLDVNGKILWQTSLKSGDKYLRCSMNKNQYFLWQGDNCTVLDALTGRYIKREHLLCPIGYAYNSHNEPVVFDNTLFCLSSEGITAINLETLKILWDFHLDSYGIEHSMLIKDKILFAYNEKDSFLYALDTQTGKVIWKFRTVPDQPQKTHNYD